MVLDAPEMVAIRRIDRLGLFFTVRDTDFILFSVATVRIFSFLSEGVKAAVSDELCTQRKMVLRLGALFLLRRLLRRQNDR